MNDKKIKQYQKDWNISPEAVERILERKESPECRLLHVIQIGRDSAIYSALLQRALSLDHGMIERAAHNLRNVGFPIFGCADGYFMAMDIEEAAKALMSLRGRALATFTGSIHLYHFLKDAGAFDADEEE